MSKGILITNGADIGYASPLDFVLDSRLKGGLKIAQKLILDPTSDLTFDSFNFYYYGQRSHGLGYVPAVLVFHEGKFGNGWQNEAFVANPAANADANNIYFSTYVTTSPLYVIIFQEKVSDT